MTNQNPPRFTCNINGCGMKFHRKAEKDAHRVSTHGRASNHRPLAAMGRDDVWDMVEAMDLPDGAHWAMIEELSGLEPGDFA